MRTLASPRNWPPSYADELASILKSVRPAPSDPERDVVYTLATAVAELEEWLGTLPGDQQKKDDHQSLVADVEHALRSRGERTNRQTPTASTLLRELRLLAPAKGKTQDAAQTMAHLRRLQTELADPHTSVAAFDDLVDAVKSKHTSQAVIAARLAVLTGALRCGHRSPAEVCNLLGEVIDDQQWEINIARRDLDGTPPEVPPEVDRQANLVIDERLALSRRYLLQPARPGNHIVWLAYKDARVSAYWREQVGLVEFFDGPILIDLITNPVDVTTGQSRSATPLPEELLALQSRLYADTWPRSEDHEYWAAARVELGDQQTSTAVPAARDQSDAIVELARFNRGGSTWQPLEGHLHFVDGRLASVNPFREHQAPGDFGAGVDRTADEFNQLAETVGPRLLAKEPMLRRLLNTIGSINESTASNQPDLILGDIRAIEFLAGQCQFDYWKEFLLDSTTNSHAWNQAKNELYLSVYEILSDRGLNIAGRDDLLARLEDTTSGSRVVNYGAALDLVPQLLAGAPSHCTRFRRLRDIERRIKDGDAIGQWIDDIGADYIRQVGRTKRLRNALTHSGAAQVEVARTVRVLINMKARNLARLALEAVVEGQTIEFGLAAWRDDWDRWRAKLPDCGTVREALFEPATKAT